MHSTTDYAQQLLSIEERGVVVMHDISHFSKSQMDFVCPHLTLVICTSGVTRSLYDLQKLSQQPYDVSCVLPGHIIHPLDNSEDFRSTIVVLSNTLYHDLQFHTFSHDFDKFNTAPICSLTEEQARQLLAIADGLETIASHTEEELPHRHDMLLSLLAIGYEFLNLYRRDQDKLWAENPHAGLLNRFCDLVVAHYRESREVQYYARLLNLTPKHFSKVFRSLTGGQTPANWIEQYVAAQARLILRTQRVSVKETAYRLGFTEAASFCRFFKHATGMTPEQYRNK